MPRRLLLLVTSILLIFGGGLAQTCDPPPYHNPMIFIGASTTQWGVADPGAEPETHPNYVSLVAERLVAEGHDPTQPEVVNVGCGGAVVANALPVGHPLHQDLPRNAMGQQVCGSRTDGGPGEPNQQYVVPDGQTFYDVRAAPHFPLRKVSIAMGVNEAAHCSQRAVFLGETELGTPQGCADHYRATLEALIAQVIEDGSTLIYLSGITPSPLHYEDGVGCLPPAVNCGLLLEFVAPQVALDRQIRGQAQSPGQPTADLLQQVVYDVVAEDETGYLRLGPNFGQVLDELFHFPWPAGLPPWPPFLSPGNCCNSHPFHAGHQIMADALYETIFGSLKWNPPGWE